MTNAGGLGVIWAKVRGGYTEAVLLLFMTILLCTVYFGATTILPPLMFLAGVLCIGCFNPMGPVARAFWPVMGVTAAILIMAFLRSDFVAMVLSGKGIGESWGLSNRYFRAPMIMWFTTWALIFAVCGLNGRRARRTLNWMCWLIIPLFAIQAVDAISNDGLRNWINVHWFGNHRPEMVVVDASNLNTFLLMLIWPLAFWLIRKRWIYPLVGMVIVTMWAAVTVDTNAQIVSFVIAAFVFWAARSWPVAWSRRGVLPECVLAGLAAFWVMIFPLVVISLVRTGLAKPLHDHLPPSWAARIDIWSYAVARSQEKPWFGWGYEAARQFEPYIPDHTHNLSLQAWLELGIPGLLLLALAWSCIFWFQAPRQTVETAGAELSIEQRARPYMMAGAVNYFVLNALSYGMWKQWLHCIAAMMLITAILAIKAIRFDIHEHNALSDNAG